MRHLKPLSLTALALTTSALAWVPKLDEQTAKTVIDGAYDRIASPKPTLLALDLSVKDGKFASPEAVKTFSGGDSCLTNWLASPTDFAQYGSRPQGVTLTGQADEVFLAAQSARDEFKNLSAKEALAKAGRLPDGNLRVYVSMAGLPSEKARDAYNVALRGADGKPVQPYRKGFTNDWKQAGGTWGGTMVYYFDALKAGLKPDGKLTLLMRTEADSDCAYEVTADLSKFN